MSRSSNIILGSSSKARQAVLVSHGFEFKVMKPDIEEKLVAPGLRSDPSRYTLAVAKAKMEALLPKIMAQMSSFPNPTVIVTCDQVVSWEGQVREKPESAEVRRSGTS